MQVENQSSGDFSERTDALATALKISLRDLAAEIGISQAMLFAYRTGKNPITEKAWKKLRDAEMRGLVRNAPQVAIREVDQGLTHQHHGTRPLDNWMRPTEEDVVKLTTALLDACTRFNVWMVNTDDLTKEYFQRMESLARGVPLTEEQRAELPDLTKEVMRRREKLPFMRKAMLTALSQLVGN